MVYLNSIMARRGTEISKIDFWTYYIVPIETSTQKKFSKDKLNYAFYKLPPNRCVRSEDGGDVTAVTVAGPGDSFCVASSKLRGQNVRLNTFDARGFRRF